MVTAPAAGGGSLLGAGVLGSSVTPNGRGRHARGLAVHSFDIGAAATSAVDDLDNHTSADEGGGGDDSPRSEIEAEVAAQKRASIRLSLTAAAVAAAAAAADRFPGVAPNVGGSLSLPASKRTSLENKVPLSATPPSAFSFARVPTLRGGGGNAIGAFAGAPASAGVHRTVHSSASAAGPLGGMHRQVSSHSHFSVATSSSCASPSNNAATMATTTAAVVSAAAAVTEDESMSPSRALSPAHVVPSPSSAAGAAVSFFPATRRPPLPPRVRSVNDSALSPAVSIRMPREETAEP